MWNWNPYFSEIQNKRIKKKKHQKVRTSPKKTTIILYQTQESTTLCYDAGIILYATENPKEMIKIPCVTFSKI